MCLLSACGGGSDGQPASYPEQNISGTVVFNGAVVANAAVFFFCRDAQDNMRTYYTSADTNGRFSKALATATAPCVVRASAPTIAGDLYSYAKALNANTTVNITPLTDAILALTMGKSQLVSLTSYPEDFRVLRAKLAAGADTAAWSQLRDKLLSGSYFNDAADVNAMTGDPINLGIDATSTAAGHWGLLKNLGQQNFNSIKLQTLALGVRYLALQGDAQAELQDLVTGLVWQRCVVGMVWDGSTCTGTPSLLLWSEVQSAVAQTPKSTAPGAMPWRVADIYELLALLDITTGSGIDPTWFPATPAVVHWTSYPITAYPPYIEYTVDMQTGAYGGGTATDRFVVRLVR